MLIVSVLYAMVANPGKVDKCMSNPSLSKNDREMFSLLTGFSGDDKQLARECLEQLKGGETSCVQELLTKDQIKFIQAEAHMLERVANYAGIETAETALKKRSLGGIALSVILAPFILFFSIVVLPPLAVLAFICGFFQFGIAEPVKEMRDAHRMRVANERAHRI